MFDVLVIITQLFFFLLNALEVTLAETLISYKSFTTLVPSACPIDF